MRTMLVATVVSAATACAPARDTAYWHWGNGVARLPGMGATIFVQTARIVRDAKSGRIRCVSFAHDVANPAFKGRVITPVVQMSARLARTYGAGEIGAIAAATHRCAMAAREAFRAHGIATAGLQLDFDVPTRRLADLGTIARALADFRPLSATALVSWLGRNRGAAPFVSVAGAFDLFVPMTFDEASLARLDVVFRMADGIGIPYRIGLPAFSEVRTLVGGRLRGFRPLDEETLAEPGWVRADGPTLTYRRGDEELHVVSADRLRSWIARVVAHDSSRNRGAVLFRLPHNRETSSAATFVPSSQVSATCVVADAGIRVVLAPPRGNAALDVAVEVAFRGAAPTGATAPPPWGIEFRCGDSTCGPLRATRAIVTRRLVSAPVAVRIPFDRAPTAVRCALQNPAERSISAISR